MPEPIIIEFDYKEVATALIRAQKIKEGLWGLSFKFGIQGANLSSEISTELTPAAIVPILNIGLQKFDKPNNLTVDASEVNPSR